MISGNGPPGRVLAFIKQEGLTLITCEAQLAELRSVLARDGLRPLIGREEAQDLLNHMGAVAEIVADLPAVDASTDPDDNVILAAAIAGRADLIVSGDKKHMLALGGIRNVPIVTAAVAADRLRRRRR